MPFAVLMTDMLRRQEERDRQLSRSKEYIDKRTNRQLVDATTASLGALLVVSATLWGVELNLAVRWVLGLAGLAIAGYSFTRFIRSVIRE